MIYKTINSTKPIKIWTNEIEKEAEDQLIKLSKMPFIYKHVAVMPDVHAGKGSTIGTVIATKGAIIPAAVGVDIGCGMSAVKLPIKIDRLSSLLSKLRNNIESVIPVGFQQHSVPLKSLNHLGKLNAFSSDSSQLVKANLQLGSLGGGNHFIEICKDQNDDCWVMLHSGSRNIGKLIADVHINGAKDLMKKYFIDLPDPDLAFLAQDTSAFKKYINDMHWAQNYARNNREVMMEKILQQIAILLYGRDYYALINNILTWPTLKVDCHHNYSQIENHYGSNVFVTRKGAVSARMGELGIIPGSMGAKSFIVRGLGNPESFNSCSHGAGRKMSRTKAREIFTQEDLIDQTKNVDCRKDLSIVDEIPSAYKDIDQVMNNQADLVNIEYTLNQLICIKG